MRLNDIHYHRILLIRARPGSKASRLGEARAEDWREHGRGLMVFFHGAGVEHAADSRSGARWRRLAGWHGVVLAVCSGSWARRHDQSPPDPFELYGLVGFWNHVIDADGVECFGVEYVG